MKSKWIAEERGKSCRAKLLCLLLLSLFLSGCSSHGNQLSYFNMLDAEKRTLQNKKAAEKFWSSVRPISTLSTSHYKLGSYYQQQGKFDKAIKEFAKALNNDSNYCKAYNGIAMSYDAMRRCKKAHDSYELAILCDSQEAYLYNNYACSSLLCGDYDKALVLLLEAVKLSGDNSRIKNNLILARAVIEQENGSDKLALQEEAVTLPAQTELAPLLNEDENPLTDPMDEVVTNSPLEPPEAKQVAGVPDSTPVGSAIHIQPPVLMDSLAAQRPNISLSKEEMAGLFLKKTSDTGKGADSGFESILKKNVAIVTILAKQKKNLLGQTPAKPALQYPTAAVEISNGNGVTGMAKRSAGYFRDHGFTVKRITNAKHFHFNDSMIYYREGYLQVAKELATVIPGAQNLEKVDSLGRSSIGVRVLLGMDLVTIQFPEGYAQNLASHPKLEKEQLLLSQN